MNHENNETIDAQLKRLAVLRIQLDSLPQFIEIPSAMIQLLKDFLVELHMRCSNGEFSSVSKAIKVISDELCDELSTAQNPYFRERISDIRDIEEQILYHLHVSEHNQQQIPVGCVLVVDEVSVFLAIKAINAKVAAIITRKLNPLSHIAILLRGSSIPVAQDVYGFDCFTDDMCVLVDGLYNRIVIQPDKKIISEFQHNKSTEKSLYNHFTLADGSTIELLSNCCGSWELPNTTKSIGLLRTEFFCIRLGRIPTEEEFYQEYSSIVRKRSLTTIRLIDASPEKPVPGFGTCSEELRGLSLLLQYPYILKKQLRAILRASTLGTTHLLLPMVTHQMQIKKIQEYIKNCVAELKNERIPFRSIGAVGVMIETSNAAIHVKDFCNDADFIYIGTNDLLHNTLGVSRSPKGILPPPSKDIINLLSLCVSVCKDANRPLTVCGEVVSDYEWLNAIIRIGVRAISADPEVLFTITDHLVSMYESKA